MHRQDPRLRVALLCAENLPRMATVGECWVYVQLRVGKHVMKSSPGLWPHPEFYEEFDLVARGLTLTLTVHQKGLLGLLAGPQICEFCLPDIHALLRDEEVPVSLTSLEFPETVLHIRVLPMHSGMDVACLQQLDGEERAGRPLVVEEEAAEFVDLLREFWDCATELQHIGRAKARLLRVEEAERHQLTAEYECFAAQGEPQHWLSFIALLLEEECVRQRLTGEVVDVLVTAHRYWEEQIQQMVDDTTARQAWEAYCLAALRLLWDEFRHRLDVRTTEVLQRRAWGVWRLTTWREEAERQQLRLAATYDRHKSLLVAEHVGRGAVAQASSPEWQQLALACVVEEEAVRRGEEELRWLVKRWALDRQAVEEEEAHRQQALALLERLLSVETAEERLRENLAVDFISQLLRPPLEHCLAIEATLRQEVAAEWAAALAVQRITWEAELTVLEEQWRRPQLEEQAEQSVGLVGEYGRGTLTVAEEEETCWGHLWKEVEAARRVVDFPLLETVARQELQEKWLSQWWEKRKRCAVFSLEVRNRMLLVELYCAEVTERRALGMLCVSEHSVAEHVMDERLVREAIVREENTAHPWLERVGLLLEEMAERGSAFLRFVEPCLAAIRSQEEEQWTSIWREGMNECARLHLLLDEAAERQETLRLEAGIFHCLREAARAGVAAIHQAQREKMRAEEEAERSSLAAAEDWRRQRVFQLALETMPLQICLTCQLFQDPLVSLSKKRVQKVVVVKDVPFSALYRQVEEKFRCRLHLFMHRSLAEHATACGTACGGWSAEDVQSRSTQVSSFRPPHLAAGAAINLAREKEPPLADLCEVTSENYSLLLQPATPPTSCDPTPLSSLGVLFCRPLYPGVHGLAPPSLSEAWQRDMDKKHASVVRLQRWKHRELVLLGEESFSSPTPRTEDILQDFMS
eukprot:GGOE01008472.1.p1 GENE.GGOE01008472.1~~GGOE01008472.1.p1  ORF type:complete len:922 (-),score=299.27 GGOE01008472.1:380-3145(-)